MHSYLVEIVSSLSWPFLLVILAGSIAVLAKGADMLVEEAVTLSERLGISKVFIGATIVSLGTTTPEMVVSVMSALRGVPGLALGNAVGSIICDTGLILGLAIIIGPVPIQRSIVFRQGYIQLGAAVLLVLVSVPWAAPQTAFERGGVLSQNIGFLFVFLLVAYIWASIQWARKGRTISLEEYEGEEDAPLLVVIVKLILGIALVILASELLVNTATEMAIRMQVPESVIAATLVAFGTSLPELVTALTAVRKKHGELAMGNVIGADILNVLFVVGCAAAVTGQGLQVDPHFFRVLFPAMLTVLLVFRIGIHFSDQQLKRGFGVVLVVVYVLVTVVSYR